MIKVDECPICKSKETLILQIQKYICEVLNIINPKLNEIERIWYQCKNCYIAYRSPKLDEKEQETFYKKNYRSFAFRKETPDAYFDRISNYSNDKSLNFEKVDYFLKNKKRNYSVEEINILDIGCGGGVLIKKIKEMLPNTKCYGVEPNELFANLSSRKSGAIQIINDFYDKNTFNSIKFNLIVSSDVLEHTDFPKKFLKDAYFNLKNGGCIYLIVPSSENFQYIKNITHDVFGIGHHILFSKESLKKLLMDNNFEKIHIESVKTIYDQYEIRAIAYKNEN